MKTIVRKSLNKNSKQKLEVNENKKKIQVRKNKSFIKQYYRQTYDDGNT